MDCEEVSNVLDVCEIVYEENKKDIEVITDDDEKEGTVKTPLDIEVIAVDDEEEGTVETAPSVNQKEDKVSTSSDAVIDLPPVKLESSELSAPDEKANFSAWGCLENYNTNWEQEDDKETLFKMLGIKNKVQKSSFKEFKLKTIKRKRGRPRKTPEFEGGILRIKTEKPEKVQVKPEPTKQEVEAYLQDLRLQIEQENQGKPKTRGRPIKFDTSFEVHKIKPKTESKPAGTIDFTLSNSIIVKPAVVPRKRGRPPKLNKVVKVPGKRGRPPKPKTLEDLIPKISKKRGRPPKPKTAEDLLPKVPKKRGRPPKAKPAGDLLALEELGVPVIYNDKATTPMLNDKPKMIYTYERNTENPDNEVEILDMISSGLVVVDVTDTGKGLHRKRGRPPLDPNNPQPPRIPKPIEPPRLSAKGKILGRPRKGSERPKEEPKEKKKPGRPKRPLVETEDKEPKKRGRPRKEPTPVVSTAKSRNDSQVKQWSARCRSRNYVPGYKVRVIYNCCWCREWSWDIKICSHCSRAVPTECQLMSIDEHEVIDDSLDSTRPYFHPPPIPYVRAGLMILCPGCFYYSATHDKCMECGYELSEDCAGVQIEFYAAASVFKTSQMIEFSPRLVEDDWLECPYCGLTASLRSNACYHCKSPIPKYYSIQVVKPGSKPMEWPTSEIISSGKISAPPQDYVPLFKEGRVAMCRWCCTWTWDLHRCKTCLRKLPSNTDLLVDGPEYDYVDGEEAKRPKYSPTPTPYLRPGLMTICNLCQHYSKNMKHCDGCKKRLVNCSIVDVCFVDCNLNEGDQRLPFEVRTVNFVYAVCPHCEFSTTDFEECTRCGEVIPDSVIVKPSSMSIKKPKADISAVKYKCQSVFQCEETITNTSSNEMTKKNKIPPPDYVPRYREHGIAQCRTCFTWTWDFNCCTQCYSAVQSPDSLPLVIYNVDSFTSKSIEASRPKFAAPPVPYFRPGQVVICDSCLSCTRGPPQCTDCGHVMEQKPQFVLINMEHEPNMLPTNSQVFTYEPRTTSNKNMCLCPFCGFTTENFDKCSYCNKIIPKSCHVIPGSRNLSDKFLQKADKFDPNKKLDDTEILETSKNEGSITQVDDKVPKPITKNLKVNSPIKVLTLKPVPPPKILPKNLIKINTNPLSVPTSTAIRANYLHPLLARPLRQSLLPVITEGPEPPKKKAKSDFLASMLSLGNSKLQASLAAAGLIAIDNEKKLD